MEIKVKKTVDKADAIMKAFAGLVRQRVLVGIPEAEAARNEATPITNAAIGYIAEYGSPAANIPARPFLVPGVEDAKGPVTGRLKDAAADALEGNRTGVDENLNAAGLAAQNAVRAKINTGPFAPLKPQTLAARRRRGRTGDKPLIDTGQLRNAVTYVIRNK